MYTLKNKFLEVKLDSAARIVSLKRRDGGNILTRPVDEGFRAVLAFAEAERLENVVLGSRQKWRVRATRTRIEYAADRLSYSDGQRDDNAAACQVVLRVELTGEELVFTSEVRNGTGAYFTDLEFPRVGELKGLGDGTPVLFVPVQTGRAYVDPGARLSESDAREQFSNAMNFVYPGPISMQWMALCGRKYCLALEGNDATFSASAFRISGRPGGEGAMVLLYDRYVSVNPRSHAAHPPVKLKFYEGDWHRCAEEYAAWIRPYRPPHRRPQWVMDMQGYYLVINKQQFGYEMWPYDTLPELYRHARACGCDVLGLFGWYESGHDNRYPDLKVSRTLGGTAALKRNIRKVQAEGGHLTLYFQGHLIDPNSDFCRRDAGRSTLRTIWGQEYVEYYNKSHRSGFLAEFSHKRFVLACPSVKKWRDLMVAREDWLASFGADGALYDQLGGIRPYVCFGRNHHHDGDSPARAQSGGRRKLLDALQTRSKRISPEFGFATEHVTDIYSAYPDFLHGIGVAPGARNAEADALAHPERSGGFPVPQMFRTCFPEVKITLRNPRPYMNRRYVNFAFVHSFLLEQELRYCADADDTRAGTFAEEHAYARSIADFRRRHWDILGYGTYLDNKFASSDTPALVAVSYEAGDKRAVAIWNDSDKPVRLDCLKPAPGLTVAEYLTPDGKRAGRPPARLAADSVALLLLK